MNPKHLLSTIIIFTAIFLLYSSSNAQTYSDSIAKPTQIKLPGFKLGLHIGYGYRFKPPVNEYYFPWKKNYLSKLNDNLCFGADISHFFNKYAGFGLRYNALYSHVKIKKLPRLADGDNSVFPTEEKNWIHNVGVFFTGRYFIVPHKHNLFVNLGITYVRYRNKALVALLSNTNMSTSTSESIYTDNNLALLAEIGYDFFITKKFAIGLQVSTYIGLLKFKEETIVREKVSHLDVTLGFRYYK